VLATRLLWDPLVQEAREAGVWEFYEQRVLPLQRSVMALAQRGILVNQATRKELIAQYDKQAKSLRKQLPAALDPNSHPAVRRWLYDELGLKASKRTKYGDVLAVDEETLRYLHAKHPEIKELNTLLGYREASKILSTYLRGVKVDADGRLRCQWLVHGTTSGRFSSRRPNLQNVPGAVRRMYVAPEGWLLAGLDYRNIEARILAHLTQDETLTELFARDGDLHALNAQELFRLDFLPKAEDPRRHFAKTFMYGVIMYGGSPRTVKMDPVLLDLVPGGRRQIEQMAAEWFRLHPQVLQWRQAISKEVQANGRLYNWAGRLRIFLGHHHERIRAGWNFPIQSGAADIINGALIRADQEIRTDDFRIIGQHHDAFLVEYRRLEWVYKLQGVMEQPVVIKGREFSCPVKVTVGPNWGDLRPLPRASAGYVKGSTKRTRG